MKSEKFKPRILFSWGDTRLDLIAAKICWDYDRNKWHHLQQLLPGLSRITAWDDKKIAKIFSNHYGDISETLVEKAGQFTAVWQEIEGDWLDLMELFFDSGRLFANQSFMAHLGAGLIFPRDITAKSFLVSYRSEKRALTRLCSHETSHFFFYHRLCQLFPQLSAEIMRSKKVWLLSEILVPLLFSSAASRALLGHQPLESYVCQSSLIASYEDLFQARLNDELSFKTFFERIMALPMDNTLVHAEFCHGYQEEL